MVERIGARSQNETRVNTFIREVITTHSRPLTMRVLPMVGGNDHNAEDIVQETFLRVFSHAERLAVSSNIADFMPWLVTTARRIAIDTDRRKKARLSEHLVGDFKDEANIADPTINVEKDATDNLTLTQAMKTLSPLHREVLQLVYFEDISHEAAAERLGVPVGTVKSRLNNALKALRNTLTESI